MENRLTLNPVWRASRSAVRRACLLGLSIAVFGAEAFAQTPTTLIGNWTVTWKGESRDREAALSITPAGGTWQSLYHQKKKNPCAGRDFPIEIAAKGDDEAVITVRGSKSLQGCRDFSLTMTLTDANTGTGNLDDSELVFKRR